MNYIQRSLLFLSILASLLLISGFVNSEGIQEKQSLSDKTISSLQALESQFILTKEVSEHLGEQTENRILANYADQIDSTIMAFQRDYCILIIQNQWDVNYALLPEDGAFLQTVKRDYHIGNKQFFNLLTATLNRMNELLENYPEDKHLSQLQGLCKEVNDQHQTWISTTQHLKAINADLIEL